MKRRVRIVVTGRVQGVGFRAATAEAASRLAVLGWVANRSDGAVEIEAQGTEEQITQFLAWCHQGPRWARVESVEVEDRPGTAELTGFAIRHAAC